MRTYLPITNTKNTKTTGIIFFELKSQIGFQVGFIVKEWSCFRSFLNRFIKLKLKKLTFPCLKNGLF